MVVANHFAMHFCVCGNLCVGVCVCVQVKFINLFSHDSICVYMILCVYVCVCARVCVCVCAGGAHQSVLHTIASMCVHDSVCVRVCVQVEFINLFFTQEQLLQEAQAATQGEIVPPNGEGIVIRYEVHHHLHSYVWLGLLLKRDGQPAVLVCEKDKCVRRTSV